MAAAKPRYRALAREVASFDPWLLTAVLALCGVGLVMVLSASSVLAASRHHDAYHLFKRQCLSLGLGLGMMTLCRFLPLGFYRRLAYPALIACLALLALVLIPGLGHQAGGATRWLGLGGFSLQPSEAAKLALVLFLAYSMAKKGDKMADFSIGIVPHLIVGAILIGLTLLQNDLGMAVILGLLLAIMLFLGGARLRHLLLLGALAGPMVLLMIFIAPYRLQRLATFLDPWGDPLDKGFQIIHSFLAFGSGGIIGQGIGSGRQKLAYLPEPHTDFIFSVIAEEAGLIGVGLVIGLFMTVAWRGFYWARRAEEPFVRLLASGLTLLILLQALINMAVVVGLLPTTGLTLPLVSYGGSSLVVNLAAAGVLLRLSADLRKT